MTPIPETLWRRLAEAPHRLLAFDFDGTLAPYARDPRAAQALPESLERLRRLAGRDATTVAVVSGRSIPNLERVVPIETLHLVGEHGWEQRPPGGSRTTHHPLSPQAAEALDRIFDAVTRDGTRALLERKRTGVAIHTRALDERDRDAAIEHFRSVCRLGDGAGLRLDLLDGGAEVHALGRDKGTAVRGLLAPLPAGTVAIYVGDDVTDEPAFEAAQERGFGLKVGSASTCARHALEDPRQVADLLAGILRALEEAG